MSYFIPRPSHPSTVRARLSAETGTYRDEGHTNMSPLTRSALSPTSNNDAIDTAGFGQIFKAGSFWFCTLTQTLYVCKDATSGSAEWAPMTGSLEVAPLTPVAPLNLATGQDLWVKLICSSPGTDLCEFWISEESEITPDSTGFQQFLVPENFVECLARPNTTFYWKVRRVSSEFFLASAWSEIQSFTSSSAIPQLVYPPEASTGILNDCTFLFILPNNITLPVVKTKWHIEGRVIEKTTGDLSQLTYVDRSNYGPPEGEVSWYVDVYYLGLTNPIISVGTGTFTTVPSEVIVQPEGFTEGNLDRAGVLTASPFKLFGSGGSRLAQTSATWQVSADDFNTIFWESLEDPKKLASISLPILPIGSYKWRVKYASSTHESVYSEVKNISILDLASLRMTFVNSLKSLSIYATWLGTPYSRSIRKVGATYLSVGVVEDYTSNILKGQVLEFGADTAMTFTPGNIIPEDFYEFYNNKDPSASGTDLFVFSPIPKKVYFYTTNTKALSTWGVSIQEGPDTEHANTASPIWSAFSVETTDMILLGIHTPRVKDSFFKSVGVKASLEGTPSIFTLYSLGYSLLLQDMVATGVSYCAGGSLQEVVDTPSKAILANMDLNTLSVSTAKTYTFASEASCERMATYLGYAYMCVLVGVNWVLMKVDISDFSTSWCKALTFGEQVTITGVAASNEGVAISYTGYGNTAGGVTLFTLMGEVSKGFRLHTAVTTCSGVLLDAGYLVASGQVVPHTIAWYENEGTAAFNTNGDAEGHYCLKWELSKPLEDAHFEGYASKLGLTTFVPTTSDLSPTEEVVTVVSTPQLISDLLITVTSLGAQAESPKPFHTYHV